MQTISQRRVDTFARALLLGSLVFAVELVPGAYAVANAGSKATTVEVALSEWNVTLKPAVVPPGPVIFRAVNAGAIPHAFEIEGKGIEKSTTQIKPGTSATFELDLSPGSYEAYCPIGKGSHKMLGMMNHLTVARPRSAGEDHSGRMRTASNASAQYGGMEYGDRMDDHMDDREEQEEEDEYTTPSSASAKVMKVVGGGPVIQILPGPYPFADSAMAVIRERPADQQRDLTKKAHLGPYSNNVAAIRGNISLTAIERGASGDSVSGVATFTTQDGARWKMVLDRVQTKDIPFNPRFGGVIMGLYYHGATNVHTPLVPTIQSSVALWGYAHLYRNDRLVTDNAGVHIMLLSRTRRTSDWALDCWECSNQPIEELQLQVTPPPNTPAFEAPGGVLFVNWEKSSGMAVGM